ncbi:MAG: c-type cytochrome [Leptospirales bacterium]
MKKLLTLTVAVAVAGSMSLVFAADGATIFKKNGCTSCHNPTKDQLKSGLGPSLVNITKAYKAGGGKAALVTFLQGKGAPIVAPKKFNTMKTQLGKTKKLSDADRSALADYILSN